MNQHPVLEIDHLSFRFKQGLFRNVSLSMNEGEFVVLMGENGAGKTTLFECLSGEKKPSSGTIRFFGETLTAKNRPRLFRRVGWVHSPEEVLPPMIEVRNFLRAISPLYPTWDLGLEKILLEGFQLDPQKSVNTLSHGERAKLKLVRALAFRPALLICDELTANLSPPSRDRVVKTLIELMSETKTSILYSCHSEEEATRLADRVIGLTSDGLVNDEAALRSLRKEADVC